MTHVVAAVLERDGKVLVCRRRAEDPHPLKWEFPGGKVEPGESAAEALRRELREELDLEAEIGPEIERYEFAYPGRRTILLIFHSVARFAGEPRNRVFDRIEWAERAALAAYDFLEGDVEFVRRLSS